MRVLTNEDNELFEALRERLSTARQVDIATAWATEGRAIRLLESCQPDALRVIVGLHGSVTTPRALRCLDKIACLRIAPSEPMFHPKVFVFHDRGGGKIGWIGSANLTHRGFGHNGEAVLELADADALSRWFDRQWTRCGLLDLEALDRYCSAFKRPPGPFAQDPPRLEVPAHLGSKHARISHVLLDNSDLDDLDAWEIVRQPSGECYSDNKWHEDMRWNRRFIYTAIRVLGNLAEHGRPIDAKRVITHWCKRPGTKWLAGVVSVAIDRQMDVGDLGDRYMGEGVNWARAYVPKLRDRDASDRQRICAALVRKTVPGFFDKTVDVPLLQLWPKASRMLPKPRT